MALPGTVPGDARGIARGRLIVALVLGLAAVTFALQQGSTRVLRVESLCGGAQPIRVGDTVACAHSDEAPPGVEVHVRPSTGALKAREGAGPVAYEAAQELGLPATQVATTATDPTVPCDGDGTSGYRVQTMYVVEAGSTNRYSDLKSSFQRWAAGTDDVVNRSAALTGGVRHLRYVTEAGASGCVASVLNVTVPSGALGSFSSTIQAVQALGYTDVARKYLMWTDATSLCGVATMYTTDTSDQSNPNNGSYAQYARVDSGCWGLGDGSNQHSVEAHELMHTLGGVQNTAAHSTNAGHCWDESDTMCYADGGTHAMVQVCPPEREYFYDCNNDDYFSTYPDPGSYLATHWNAADSRFLIGGGTGAGGGTPGSPTVLGASIAVNNPAVPGLATQVSVTPTLPTGRTVANVTWTSKRTDCTFAPATGPDAVQSAVTCNANATGSTSVTAVLTDSSGATKTLTSPLIFATGSPRPVTLTLVAAGQPGTDVSVCKAGVFPLRARLTDTASGQPIKGLVVGFTKQAVTATTIATAGTGTTTAEGAAVLNQSATVATRYSAKSTAGSIYGAADPVTVTATPTSGPCTIALSVGVDTSATYLGDPVTVTGTLTRQLAGDAVPVGSASLPVRLTSVSGTSTKVTLLGNAVTTPDGTFRLVVKPATSGVLSVEVPASTAYVGVKVALGDLSVALASTTLAATAAPMTVGYGGNVTVSGTLQRDEGGNLTALAGSSVAVVVTKDSGVATKVATAKVGTGGTYSILVPLKITGALAVTYAGAPGQPAAAVVVGPVVAGTWTTSLSVGASVTHVPVGGAVTFTGSLTRTFGPDSGPVAAQRVSAYFTANGSSTRTLVASAVTTAAGSYTVKVLPKASGTWTLVYAGVIGYSAANSADVAVTVG